MISGGTEEQSSTVKIQGPKTKFSLDSRSSIELDLAQIMVNGELSILREVEERGLLFLRFQRKKVIVSAGGYIGLIPLTPSVIIEVNPKLPVRNLARVINTARAHLVSLKSTDRLYRSEYGATGSVFEFLVANFLDALLTLELHGLHKEYLELTRATSHPSGRIKISGSAQRYWSKNQTHTVLTEYFEHSSNIAINRVIKRALIFLLERMKSWPPNDPALIKLANRILSSFPASIGRSSSLDIEVAKDAIKRRLIPSQRDYYYRALDAALLILSNGGVSLQAKGHDVTLRSFIVNFDDLFENYVRHLLQASTGPNISVLDGNLEGKRPLFSDRKHPPAQPDIVIRAPYTSRLIVADVKYKDGVKREDINQAVTYAVAYGTSTAVIIHQMKLGGAPGLYHVGKIGGIAVKAYALNLDCEDLELEERSFTEAMFALAA